MAKPTDKPQKPGIYAPDATLFNPGLRLYGPYDDHRIGPVDDLVRRRAITRNIFDGELDPEGLIDPPIAGGLWRTPRPDFIDPPRMQRQLPPEAIPVPRRSPMVMARQGNSNQYLPPRGMVYYALSLDPQSVYYQQPTTKPHRRPAIPIADFPSREEAYGDDPLFFNPYQPSKIFQRRG